MSQLAASVSLRRSASLCNVGGRVMVGISQGTRGSTALPVQAHEPADQRVSCGPPTEARRWCVEDRAQGSWQHGVRTIESKSEECPPRQLHTELRQVVAVATLPDPALVSLSLERPLCQMEPMPTQYQWPHRRGKDRGPRRRQRRCAARLVMPPAQCAHDPMLSLGTHEMASDDGWRIPTPSAIARTATCMVTDETSNWPSETRARSIWEKAGIGEGWARTALTCRGDRAYTTRRATGAARRSCHCAEHRSVAFQTPHSMGPTPPSATLAASAEAGLCEH